MDCDSDVSDSESDGYGTLGEADFSLIAQGNDANHDMTYEGESGQQRICLLEGNNEIFSSYNEVLPILSVATPREEKLDQQDFIAGCQGPLSGGKIASYVYTFKFRKNLSKACLKEAIDTLNVKTCSMSKTGNGLDRLA